jgi:hypothetical protein
MEILRLAITLGELMGAQEMLARGAEENGWPLIEA